MSTRIINTFPVIQTYILTFHFHSSWINIKTVFASKDISHYCVFHTHLYIGVPWCINIIKRKWLKLFWHTEHWYYWCILLIISKFPKIPSGLCVILFPRLKNSILWGLLLTSSLAFYYSTKMSCWQCREVCMCFSTSSARCWKLKSFYLKMEMTVVPQSSCWALCAQNKLRWLVGTGL